MLGGNEFRLRQGFAFGKTLVRRKGAAPPCGVPGSGIYSVKILQKEGHDYVVSFFLSSAPFGALHPIYLICSGRMNRPGIKVLPAGKTLERRESAAPLCRAGEAVRAVRCVPGRTDRWSFAVIGMPRKSYLSSPDWFYRRGGRAPAVGRQRPSTPIPDGP